MVDILSLRVHFIFLKFCELSVQSCNFYNLSPANISLHYNKNKKNLKLVFKNGYFSASNRISLICLIIQSAHITLVPVTFRVSINAPVSIISYLEKLYLQSDSRSDVLGIVSHLYLRICFSYTHPKNSVLLLCKCLWFSVSCKGKRKNIWRGSVSQHRDHPNAWRTESETKLQTALVWSGFEWNFALINNSYSTLTYMLTLLSEHLSTAENKYEYNTE